MAQSQSRVETDNQLVRKPCMRSLQGGGGSMDYIHGLLIMKDEDSDNESKHNVVYGETHRCLHLQTANNLQEQLAHLQTLNLIWTHHPHFRGANVVFA